MRAIAVIPARLASTRLAAVTFLLRTFSGILGLFAACVALVIPLLFRANTLQEAESAKQYGGHALPSGAIGGVTVVLLVAALFGAGAYFLLRFSLCGRKPIGVDHAARAFAENRHAATSRRTCS